MSAVSVEASTVPFRGTGPGASPRTALQRLQVKPVPFRVVKTLLVRHHYLHSVPGGTQLALGVFDGRLLVGALTLGVGPKQAYRLVEGAKPEACTTLTRFWLSDGLPPNAASRFIGVVLRALKRNTELGFLVTYADPAYGHVGTIYQATGWVYTGLSQSTGLLDLGDGIPRHTRSVGHAFGTRSIKHSAACGVPIQVIGQKPKHRYVYFIDPVWRDRLRVPAQSFPRST